MFSVRCIQIVGKRCVCSGSDVMLYREVQLPFAPYPGLRLRDGDWEFEVTDARYDVHEGVFKCYAAVDRPPIREQRSDEEMAAIVNEYINAGWQR